MYFLTYTYNSGCLKVPNFVELFISSKNSNSSKIKKISEEPKVYTLSLNKKNTHAENTSKKILHFKVEPLRCSDTAKSAFSILV